MTPLTNWVADQNHLIEAARAALGAGEVVAFEADALQATLLKAAVRGPVRALAGVLVRSWDRDDRRTSSGSSVGLRVYALGELRFCWVSASPAANYEMVGDFFAVARGDYAALYRKALELKRAATPVAQPPVAHDDTLAALRRNTVDYLVPANLARIRALGGRPKRGLLLSGPPGNGKTSACRWLRRLCHERGLEVKSVKPDDFRAARASESDPGEAVRRLFNVERAGVVVFDDFDAALCDRGGRENAEDQAIFLGALDGMEVPVGVAHVFTTNLPFHKIDPAFRRPGRLDVVLQFPKPDADLRRRLIARWHPDLLAGIDFETAVAETDGMSFAEVDELKNLLVLRFTEADAWDWRWARDEFRAGRADLAATPRVGFGAKARA